jgi:hypothetical protein
MALFLSAESPMGVFAPKEQRIRGFGEVASVPLFEGRWVFFGGHQKLGEVLGHCWSMKIDLSPPIILFYGDEGLYWDFFRCSKHGQKLFGSGGPPGARANLNDLAWWGSYCWSIGRSGTQLVKTLAFLISLLMKVWNFQEFRFSEINKRSETYRNLYLFVYWKCHFEIKYLPRLFIQV